MSPGLTENDGMSTFLPFTVKWPCRTSWRACGRDVAKPEAIGHVVETTLEQLQQRLAGDAARPLRLLEVAAELILEHAVDALHLLLLAQLHAVAGQLRLPRLAVLPWREVALLDRALLACSSARP